MYYAIVVNGGWRVLFKNNDGLDYHVHTFSYIIGRDAKTAAVDYAMWSNKQMVANNG